MLDHPSLIKVIDQAQTDTEFVIVFEHCKLGTIKEHMYMNSGYSHKEIAYIIKQLLQPLNELHSCGRAHRDLSIDSLFVNSVSNDGPEIMLSDFGNAV